MGFEPTPPSVKCCCLLQVAFCGFEPTPPSAKQISRVHSNSSADALDLKDISRSPQHFKDVSRSPQRSSSDQIIHQKDSTSPVESGTAVARSLEVKDGSRSLRRPLSDSTNVGHDVTGLQSQQQQQQGSSQSHQRRLLHPALAHRRASCVRLHQNLFFEFSY